MEQGTVEEVLLEPRMPYTMGLLESIPTVEKRGGRLSAIKGAVPSPFHLPPALPLRAALPVCASTPAGPWRPSSTRSARAASDPAATCTSRREAERLQAAIDQHNQNMTTGRTYGATARRDQARMTTVVEAAPIADPVVRRKLRRRPPPSIRNGRALLLGVAGYGAHRAVHRSASA